MKSDELALHVEALKARLDAIAALIDYLRQQQDNERNEKHANSVRLSVLEQRLPDAEKVARLAEQLAVLASQVEDLRKTREEWGRRLWMIVPPILAALLGVLAGYFLKR